MRRRDFFCQSALVTGGIIAGRSLQSGCSILSILMILIAAGSCGHGQRTIKVKSPRLEIRLSAQGEISSVYFPVSRETREVTGRFSATNCVVEEVDYAKQDGGAVQFTKTLVDTVQKRRMEIVEIFAPTSNSIRWSASITSEGEPWNTPIVTRLKYPVRDQTTFWTAWADPRGDEIESRPDNVSIANAILPNEEVGGNWSDPLVSMPPDDALWYYGATDFSYDHPGRGFVPFQGDIFCIPSATFLEKKNDLGFSMVLSHEELILDLHLETSKEGDVFFTRLNHRLGGGRKLEFSVDLIAHEADWRSVMKWMAERYPAYYHPVNPMADQVAGTAAYSNNDVEFDVEKMKRMDFKVNWRASFDFPYMGMFLPPLHGDQPWESFVRYGNRSWQKPWIVSVSIMEEYCRKMLENGFYVLNYFNVTEFGAQIKYPPPPRKYTKEEDLWKDANDFLYTNLPEAILYSPKQQVRENGDLRPVSPYMTWESAVAMDPGEPGYQEFLVGQANRHVKELPSSSGICIDRMDWLRMYNHKADDGVSWFGNQPVRSLYVSWHEIMGRLGPVFHEGGKLIYVNNHVKRIDLLNHVDGIFDEFTYAGAPLNTIALMCVKKPCMGWMSNDSQLLPDPDAVIQKYIYLGVYPMAPFPGNDHSMRPSPLADSIYLDYGPLFKLMEGKKWVLEPYVIEVPEKNAKANIFQVPGGYTIPVVYAGKSESVKVMVCLKGVDPDQMQITALHPGIEGKSEVPFESNGKEYVLDVPVHRGCAMVSVTLKPKR